MSTRERVTVTLPTELVERIGHYERNRSRFVKDAVERELARRRREELLRSIERPHPDAADLADAGLDEWASSLPQDDQDLVDMASGTAVHWVEGEGWVEEAP